ncbi:MAG TPA: ATP-binding protein [Longimicrobiales bacterium]|nr:ATP-binding protein [Longimicrobiales bacterium]
MTFRTRILLACLTVAAVPLLILGTGARHVVRERLTVQYRESLDQSTEAVRAELARTSSIVEERVRTLIARLVDQPDTRAALLEANPGAALLDYAPDAMRLAGLDYLLLVDERGMVLSSGHFRNDYGRELPSLLQLGDTSGLAVVAAHRPEGAFTALVRARAFDLGGHRFRLVAGVEIDSLFVARLADGAGSPVVSLEYPDGVISAGRPAPDEAVTQTLTVPFVDADDPVPGDSAAWTVAHSLDPLHAIVRLVDRWFVIALGIALLLAFVTARVLAARVTQPLERLASNASRVELTRYDVQLASPRRDEIGSLSRLLDRMVQRLRAGAQQLRDAERRATVGDMARQVNHDIRNGLLPIRNVIHHLTEVAQQSPTELGTVFNERAGTLQGGIGYLENLATNYARLTPRTERRPCDVNAIIETLRDAGTPDDRLVLELARPLPPATADPVALRRVLENLVINALESLPGHGGRVVVRTAVAGSAAGSEAEAAEDGRVTVTVTDTGTGIAPEAVDRIFDDFYTTKERGTGLGLSIVRRLVTDMGGRVRVQSEPGRGTTFTVDLPIEGGVIDETGRNAHRGSVG